MAQRNQIMMFCGAVKQALQIVFSSIPSEPDRFAGIVLFLLVYSKVQRAIFAQVLCLECFLVDLNYHSVSINSEQTFI